MAWRLRRTCYVVTAERSHRFDDLCVAAGRDPATVRHSLVCFPPLTPWQSVEYFRDMIGCLQVGARRAAGPPGAPPTSRSRGCSTLGSEPVTDEDTGPFRHVVFAVPGGTLLGLHQFPEGTAGDGFHERRLGLDHLSFGVANRGELQAWQQHPDQMGIANGGIMDASYGSGLSYRDPDNIALEFFSPPT